jgi:hypothetical protein
VDSFRVMVLAGLIDLGWFDTPKNRADMSKDRRVTNRR